MTRLEIIQKLIDKTNAQSYLEIGLGQGRVFQKIKCSHKVGVDPCFNEFKHGSDCPTKPTYKLTSDDFFNQNKETFDVIFIDGLHTADQVEIDISNALKFLNDQGYIVCHDMNPTSKAMQATPRRKATWTGDCWKAWVRIRSSNSKLNMFVVDTDFGCGIIKKGKQELLTAEDLTYTNLNNNRKEWLNLIPTKDFSSYVA